MKEMLVISVIIVILYLIKTISVKPTFRKMSPNINVNGYHIFYADKPMEDKNIISSKLLKSNLYKLNGKPDYILKSNSGEMYIPVELKSGKIKDKPLPNDNDLAQLVAYFLIIEDVYGVQPNEGRLVYSDYMFVVRNTTALRENTLNTIDKMRKMLQTGKGEAHPNFAKCKHCHCNNTVCELK